MTKILVANDFHYPMNRTARNETEVTFWGSTGLRLLESTAHHARKIGAHLVVNGDETNYNADPAVHFNTASQVTKILAEQGVIRGIGNHEPVGKLAELGFTCRSHFAALPEDSHTSILMCQPDNLMLTDHYPHSFYRYNADNILAMLEDIDLSDQNLLVVAHWSFDRMARGYPARLDKGAYIYEDTTAPINARLAELNAAFPGHVLMSGAHEHRYAHTETLGFPCYTVPAATQAEIAVPDRPCGLSHLYESTADGWKTTFQQIVFMDDHMDDYIAREVPESTMQQYFRPYLNRPVSVPA